MGAHHCISLERRPIKSTDVAAHLLVDISAVYVYAFSVIIVGRIGQYAKHVGCEHTPLYLDDGLRHAGAVRTICAFR